MNAPQSMPCSVEAETATLSAILQNPSLADDARQTLYGGDAFFVAGHRLLFDAMLEVIDSGKALDAVTLQAQLIETNNLAKVGGAAKVPEILTFAPDPTHYAHYRDIVIDRFRTRTVVERAGELVRCGLSAKTFEAIREQADAFMTALANLSGSASARTWQEVLDATVDDIENRATKKSIRKIFCGISGFDREIFGFALGTTQVIAGAPGSGKTSLACAMMWNIAKIGVPVGMFSMEMMPEELACRALVYEGRIDAERVDRGTLNEREKSALQDAYQTLRKCPIHIDERGSLTAEQLVSGIRQWHARKGVRFVVVDFLQLCRGVAEQNQERMLADVTSRLKGIAKETGVVVVELSQVNDDGKVKGGRCIAENADGLFVIGENGNVHVAKNRGGRAFFDIPNLRFVPSMTRWE